jgi:hypothetical protein
LTLIDNNDWANTFIWPKPTSSNDDPMPAAGRKREPSEEAPTAPSEEQRRHWDHDLELKQPETN